MKVKKIIINGLYGYIDKEIFFNEDISLLVGINGSGKTSILNLINWILKPSLAHLCVTEFKEIILYFTYKDVDYEIECKHSKSNLKYTLKSAKSNDDYHPLNVKLDFQPTEIPNDDSMKNAYLSRYGHLRPIKEEEKTWDFINNLPSPIVIGLDRYIFVEEKRDKLFIETQEGRITRDTEIPMSPLGRVKELANTSYRKSKNEILNLTNNLKNHLMLSAFEDIISQNSINIGLKQNLTINQIESAEKRFKDYLSKFEKNIFDDNQLKTITNSNLHSR
jgi:predicted ATP-binding protein involved in virulence